MVEVFPWRWPNAAGMTPFDNVAGPYKRHTWPLTLALQSQYTSQPGCCLEVKGQAKEGPVSASCPVPSISTDRLLPFASHLSFDDIYWCLISYIREINEERLRLFHAHTCAWKCMKCELLVISPEKTDPPQLGSLSDSVWLHSPGLNLSVVSQWKSFFHFSNQTNCLIKEK